MSAPMFPTMAQFQPAAGGFPDQMRAPMRTSVAPEPLGQSPPDEEEGSVYEERDEADDSRGMGCMLGVTGGACALFVGLILLLLSWKGLHATHYGLIRNKMTGVVNFEYPKLGGRNFVGFWNEYIEFPATIQSIEWLESVPNDEGTKDLSPMNVRTSDGLTMRLGVVVQYQINPTYIPDMYKTYKDKYEGFFTSNLRSKFQVLVAEYKAEDLWVERKNVSRAMKTACDQVCAERMGNMLMCWGVQLLANHLDPKIESTIVNRQVEVQKQDLEKERMKTERIRSETLVLKADYDMQIAVVKANASAYAGRLVNIANADADYNTAASRGTAMQLIQDNIKVPGGLGGPTDLTAAQLVAYMSKNAIISDPGNKMLYGVFNGPTEL